VCIITVSNPLITLSRLAEEAGGDKTMSLSTNQLDLIRSWAGSFAHYGPDAEWLTDRTFFEDCGDDSRLFPLANILEAVIEGEDLEEIQEAWFPECNTETRTQLLDIATFCHELNEYADHLPGGSEIVTPDAGTPFDDGVKRVLEDAKHEIYIAAGWN
jgi:hypothetical protein